jgi:hypothetical protein
MSRNRKLIALACAIAVVPAVLVGSSAIATHAPANKAVASGSKIEVFSENGSSQTGVELNRVLLKTSKTTDLMMHVTAECEVFTEHTRDGKQTVNEAEGSVRMWLEFDGKIVPIQSASAPPQDPAAQPAGDESDKVTFCRRHEGFNRTDNNILCIEGQAGPPPINPQGCEFESWFNRTKTANAFNWVRLNTGSGDHTIVLKADIVTATGATTLGEVSQVRAAVGNRTLIVEPTKMSNDTIVAPVGTS